MLHPRRNRRQLRKNTSLNYPLTRKKPLLNYSEDKSDNDSHSRQLELEIDEATKKHLNRLTSQGLLSNANIRKRVEPKKEEILKRLTSENFLGVKKFC
jgi:hypothetical protein